MNPNPQADTIEQHLEVNRQAAQALAKSVKECCRAAEKHLRPRESEHKNKDAIDSS